MQKIIPTINPNTVGKEVQNLQEAILFLLDKKIFKALQPPNSPTDADLKLWTKMLKKEKNTSLFGEGTRMLVFTFQLQQSLGDNLKGIVEEKTAAALNKFLESFDALDEPVKNFIVNGTILKSDGSIFADVLVRAIDKDMYGEDLLGEIHTNKKGYYKISYTEEQFRKSNKEKGGADLIVRVFDSEENILASSKKINNAGPEEILDIVVNIDDIPVPVQFIVHGLITSDGNPLKDATVHAFDKDLRKEELLGKTKTDKTGYYKITYSKEQFSRGEKGFADLIVRVFDKKSTLLVQSAVVRPENAEAIINLNIPVSQLSEWETIKRSVWPLLDGQGLDGKVLEPWNLNPDDITFIIDETGLDRENLRLWVLATKTAYKSNLIGQAVLEDMYESVLFYGWFRVGLPQQFSDLLKLETDSLIKAIEQAISQNFISQLPLQFMKKLVAILENRRIEETLKPGNDGEPASLGDLLNEIPGDWLNDERQRKLATILQTTTHTSDDFLEKATKAGLSQIQALQVRQTLQLGDLTLKHAPMVRALLPIVEKDTDGKLKGLATVPAGKWLELAYEYGTPPAIQITPNQYAKNLELAVETEIPTLVLATKLNNQSLVFYPNTFSGIQSFLLKNKAFDITKDDIDQSIEDGIIDKETAKAARTLQHLKRLNTFWDEAEILVNTGIDSVEKITSYDMEQFRELLSDHIGYERLDDIYNTANALKGMSIGLMSYMQPLFYGVSAEVMGTHKNLEGSKELINNSPTLRKLFGALDNCYCNPCLSVLSPSAYLADLLKFVDSSTMAGIELQMRRPDIYDLELSCVNSEIELPQIDLAIEILENAVALPISVSLPVGTDINVEISDGNVVGETVTNVLKTTTNDILGNLIANKIISSGVNTIYNNGDNNFSVKDKYRTWSIQSFEEHFGFTGLGQYFYPLDINKVVSHDPVAELNYGNIPEGLETDVATELENGVRIKLPLSAEITEIKQLDPVSVNPLKRWEISFKAEGYIYIDIAVGNMTLNDTTDSKIITKNVTSTLLIEIKNDLNNLVISSTLISVLNDTFNSKKYNALGFRVIKEDEDLWKFIYSGKRILEYRPAAINIVGLTYQSTADDRDLFARPQNRNPLAYEILNTQAVFPWSLPYDYNLSETREALIASGIPRFSLIETASISENHYNSKNISQERLGLSSAEWALTVDISVETSGNAKTGFWKIWGLKDNSSQTIRDTFTDLDITATPFGKDGLLTRVSIILQQARLHFYELEALLESQFINPSNIKIQPDYICKPSDMRMSVDDEPGLAPLLERLHRFVRLWRATGWKIWELDLTIQADGMGGGQINDNTLIQIVNIKRLCDRLHLPIDTILAMISGFTIYHYNLLANDKLQSITPIYDRLFQNRKLLDPPIEKLSYSAGLSVQDLTDNLIGTIAAAVGIRKSSLVDLLNSNSIDFQFHPALNGSPENKNKLLQWIFRNVTLSETLGLSKDNYEIAWQLFPDSHFDSTANLLRFLDNVDFVSKSGFAWNELEYLFLNSDLSEKTPKLTNQYIATILTAIQVQMQQLNTPVPSQSLVRFPLTNDDLLAPNFPATPNDSEDRFKNHWNLTKTAQDWTVEEPGTQIILSGTGLGLLARIDVLAQQSRQQPDTIIDALNTKFVERNLPLQFTIIGGITVSINNLTEDHLDHLEIFLYLMRKSKLSLQDLELLLEIFTNPPQWNLNKLVEHAPIVLELQERLDLPLKIITDWWTANPVSDKNRSLAEALGVGLIDLKRLLKAFSVESSGKDAWSSPSVMLEFVNASNSLVQRVDVVVRNLSQALSVQPELITTCLWEYLHTSDTVPKLAMLHLIAGGFAFLNQANISAQESTLVNSNEYDIVIRLHKIALLQTIWKVSPEQLALIDQQVTGQARSFAGLVFNILPIQTPTVVLLKTLVGAWERSSVLYKLALSKNSSLPLVTNYLDGLNSGSSDSDKLLHIVELLSNSLKLSSDTVRFCFNQLVINTLDKYYDPFQFSELMNLLKMVQGLGIDHNDLAILIGTSSGADVSELCRKLLRTRFGDSGWLGGLRKMTDQLRIQQRDKLVDYLLALVGLYDVNSLYNHYLIDMEMSPCMNTTRMLQSTASVQLFVHRCLFNMEQTVSPDSISRSRWEWMQNYRVWEANRKVFLYPENWLFPELRDDRTETFRAFESNLNQKEPSHENSIKALRQYLDDLVEIGQIGVIGMYEYIDNKGASLYLVGRLSNAPNVYFWRKGTNYEISGIRWTGWERIDLELNVDHIVPFVFEGDFHVAWPLINTYMIPKNEIDEFYEVRMAWARKTSTGWTKRKTSVAKLPFLLEKPVNKDVQETFFLKLQQNDIANNNKSIRINLFAQTPVGVQKMINPPPSSTTFFTGGRINKSNVFWSFDYDVANSYVKYLKPKEHVRSVASGEYQIAIAGIKRETLGDTVNIFGGGSRLDLVPEIARDIKTIMDDYRITLSELDRVGFDLLLYGPQVWPILFSPFLSWLPFLALNAIIKPFYPILAKRIDKYLNDPVFRITGNLNDYFFINNDEIALPTDRMISFGPEPNNSNIKKIDLRALGLDQNIPLPFIGQNLPNGVTSKTTLHVKIDILFEASENKDYRKKEVPLQMQSIGGFLLNSGSNDAWEAPLMDLNTNKPLVIKPLNNSKFWSNGYQETGQGNVGFMRAGFVEKMWTTVANFNESLTVLETWYLEEGGRKLIAKIEERNFVNTLYPAGYNESLLYKNLMIDSPDSLYSISSQSKAETSWFNVDSIEAWMGPNKTTHDPRDNKILGFDLSMPNANYNWEVFYHTPIAIAIFLSRQHRFEDARRWFHFIFDPTTNDQETGRERFWKFLPFRNAQAPDSIKQLLEALANPNASPEVKESVQKQVAAWLQDPFNPFAVARMRSSAFEWYTVIAYIRNLINWADQLFRGDTRESINEATLLYIMAAQILGPRPEKIRSGNKNTGLVLSYRVLNALNKSQNDYDFSNVWISLADNPFFIAWAKFLQWLAEHGIVAQSALEQLQQLSSIGSLYFCVPPNEKFPELWDLVEDRLFKIRNCQNIEGIIRNLPLYEPPIDPELLIRAKAAGVSIADVLSDLSAPLPHYRFQVLLQKANEFCNEVRGFGVSILSAIEKKESEHLGLLRSSQEIAMLVLIESVKLEQIKEASANIDALSKTKNNALDRFKFLQQQLGKTEIKFDSWGSPIVEQSFMTQVQETGTPDGFRSLSLIQSEIDQIKQMELSNLFSVIAGVHRFSAGVSHLVGLYPPAKSFAEAIGFALSATADGFNTLSGHMSFLERRSSQMAIWQRRRDEWVQQSRMTADEICQLDKQIISLEIRKSIVEKELANHRTQIDHTRNIDDYLRHMKFSGESLYGWMESQLAGLYFSAYQLAYDLAKKAEKAYRHEIGETSSSFIQYGYWDNLRKGLLSGEKLGQDLRRMESSYLNRNKRELEITKHISLKQLDPIALIFLREKGFCEFEIPEVLLDMDFPGHYFRRIKSVSISIPCVVGPYNSVSGTLTLLSSKLRDNYLTGSDYSASDNYKSSYLPIQSIATSSGQNDSGLFELNFRDERYLPFEGAGVISTWRFTLPDEFRQFDYNTISDVVLHMKYTARDGGSGLKTLANASVRSSLAVIKQELSEEGLHLVLDFKHDMPNEWNLLKKEGITNIRIDKGRLPYMVQATATINTTIMFISRIEILRLRTDIDPDNDIVFNNIPELALYRSNTISVSLGSSFKLYGYKEGIVPPEIVTKSDVDNSGFELLDDLIMVIKYSL